MTCLCDKNLDNFEIASSDKMIWKVQKYHQHILDNIMVYIPKGICIKNFVQGKPKIYYLVKDLTESPSLLRQFACIAGNKVKGRISKRAFQENKARQIFRKTNISYPLIRTRTYVRYKVLLNMKYVSFFS